MFVSQVYIVFDKKKCLYSLFKIYKWVYYNGLQATCELHAFPHISVLVLTRIGVVMFIPCHAASCTK